MGLASQKMSRREKSNQLQYNFRFRKCESILTTELCSKQPLERSGHRIVCDTVNLYCFGGYNPDRLDNPLFKELWRFNISTRRWSRYDNESTMPDELASNAVIRVEDTLFVFGGTGVPFGNTSSNSISVCSLTKGNICGQLSILDATGELPQPGYGQVVVYHSGFIYLIGGTTGFDFHCDVHRFHLKKRSWEYIHVDSGTGPIGRYRHEAACDGRFIYLFGGGGVDYVVNFESIPVFDLTTNSWSERKCHGDPSVDQFQGLPQPRRCHGLVQVQNGDRTEVFITCGFGTNILNDLWKLDLQTFCWQLIVTDILPVPTYFHSAAISPEGRMYIFGGIFPEGQWHLKRSNQLYGIWLKIPSLSEMCWEALLFYHNNLENRSASELALLGVPLKFIKRLEISEN